MTSLNVARCKLIPSECHPSKGGELFAFEALKTVPFAIKKMICIKPGVGTIRGEHAHKRLEQLWLCLAGSCQFFLDDGISQQTVPLDSPRVGLYTGAYVWHRMSHFSQDCVLVALGSDYHDPEECIQDYAQFLENLPRLQS